MKKIATKILKIIFFNLQKLLLKIGLHINPAHYYSSIPNINELVESKSIWAKKSMLYGLNINIEEQIENIKTVCLPFKNEYLGNEIFKYGTENKFGPGYGYIEAQALHSIIRKYKPKRVIEVGSGVSTWCILKANDLNKLQDGNDDFKLTCIEPYPNSVLKSLKEVNLIEKKVQEISFEDEFYKLEKNDILFIDSSHTVKVGSDVNYIILEILPRLKPGVIVHFHDIFIPYDYNRNTLSTFFHWSETTLLRAFLINNTNARIVFCMSQLHYDAKSTLKEVFPKYTPQNDKDGLLDEKYVNFEQIHQEHFPSSIYIEIV
jgi:predicted O-methyltransferase YrrM